MLNVTIFFLVMQKANPCCPNEWGNNPPCWTSTNSSNPIIPPEELKRGTTTSATCCSYHGRGFLQTSYEKNYGDLGAAMLADSSKGISAERGRQLLVNFPQAIDGFGITGWVATFAFWIMTHPYVVKKQWPLINFFLLQLPVLPRTSVGHVGLEC